jgi:hypothetical protein
MLSDKFYLLANGDILYLIDIHINNMIDIENKANKVTDKDTDTKKKKYLVNRV